MWYGTKKVFGCLVNSKIPTGVTQKDWTIGLGYSQCRFCEMHDTFYLKRTQ